ncbi:MAG: hypothetical protein DRR04_11595 [Gammaproteobacteria bacterium]|nr:MAG: hypothetical protein DRR04_11595 [Gammaproteobacteria bacterium]
MKKPKSWWQWILVYPTLVTSLLFGSSEVLRFVKAGGNAPMHQTLFAIEQKEAWERNADCLIETEMHEATNPSNIKVGVRVCPKTGDVQIQGYVPGETLAVFRWIPLSRLLNPTNQAVAEFGLMNSATASDSFADFQTGQVICQRWLQQGILLQRVYWAPTNSCFDNVINTFTGVMVSSTPAPCSSRC